MLRISVNSLDSKDKHWNRAKERRQNVQLEVHTEGNVLSDLL